MFRYFWPAETEQKVSDEEIDSIHLLANNVTTEAAQQLRQTLEVLFQNHTPLDIPAYKRAMLVIVLLKSKTWPVDGKAFVSKDVWKTKEEFLQIFDSFVDHDVKVNALLQALCKQTFLGGVFHTARLYSEPSVASGHLNKIALKLQAILSENNKADLTLCDSTVQALKMESQRNAEFSQGLIPYPSLHDLVAGQVEQDVERRYSL